ncbi:MAG TPA: hypothetical protein VFW66_05800 [Gemmatimonadales bacterium]|nr:hypothetical protein [Gemmatimonadales bacterium]
MADRVRRVNYCYTMIPNRTGQGVRVLDALTQAGVDLLAFSAFPGRGGKTQVDLVADDIGAIRRVAKRSGWRLSDVKRGFLVQGDDRIGAVERQLAKLAKARINVTAADGVAAGKGRYGMILWVKPKDVARAAKVLGAR